jgi:hypothetical protein
MQEVLEMRAGSKLHYVTKGKACRTIKTLFGEGCLRWPGQQAVEIERVERVFSSHAIGSPPSRPAPLQPAPYLKGMKEVRVRSLCKP